jgi:hypothetical protein
MSMKYRIALPVVYSKNTWTGADEYPVLSPKQENLTKYKEWCKDRVGTNGWNYYGQYRKIPFEFRFKRGEDLVAFKLTFGLL